MSMDDALAHYEYSNCNLSKNCCLSFTLFLRCNGFMEGKIHFPFRKISRKYWNLKKIIYNLCHAKKLFKNIGHLRKHCIGVYN